MSKQTVNYDFEEVEVELQDDEGGRQVYEISFSVSAVLSYSPGRFSGPPENYYPDESEVDILEMKLRSVITYGEGDEVLTVPITPALEKQLSEALDMDYIYETLWEEWKSEDELRGDAE